MKLLVYTPTHYLDTVLPRMRRLACLAETDLVVELDPATAYHGAFDVAPVVPGAGLHDARPFFEGWLPPSALDMVTACASVRFASFPAGKTLHPSAVATVRALRSFVRERRHDVLHVEGSSPRTAAVLAATGNRVKVMTLHDATPHPGEASLRDAVGLRGTLALATHVVFHSDAAARRGREAYGLQPHHTSMLRLGPGELAAAWRTGGGSTAAQAAMTVLLPGRLSAYKGITLLYEAARVLSSRVKGIRFIVAGQPVPGYDVPPAPVLTNDCHLDVRAGYINNRELARLLESASCVVLPYVESFQSGVLLAAYAFGIPVVAARSGGIPEYMRHGQTGLLVPPADPVALADALERVVLNVGLRQQLSRGIAAFIQDELNWTHIAEKTLAVYRSLSSGGNA